MLQFCTSHQSSCLQCVMPKTSSQVTVPPVCSVQTAPLEGEAFYSHCWLPLHCFLVWLPIWAFLIHRSHGRDGVLQEQIQESIPLKCTRQGEGGAAQEQSSLGWWRVARGPWAAWGAGHVAGCLLHRRKLCGQVGPYHWATGGSAAVVTTAPENQTQAPMWT